MKDPVTGGFLLVQNGQKTSYIYKIKQNKNKIK